jgi:hypothetical protein
MDHHRKPSHWLLLTASCAFVAAVTAGYGADVFDGIRAAATELAWFTRAATTDAKELVWVAAQ